MILGYPIYREAFSPSHSSGIADRGEEGKDTRQVWQPGFWCKRLEGSFDFVGFRLQGLGFIGRFIQDAY